MKGAGVAQGPVTEGGDVLVELSRHTRDPRLRQRADAQGAYQLVHTSGAGSCQVGVGEHRDQRGLGPFAALEQPVGEVRAGTQLGNSHVNGPDPGVQVPVAVAGALGPVLGAGLTVLGAAHRVGVGRQQDVDHGLQQTAHQVRGGLSQSLVKDSSRADNVRSDHRDDALSRTRWKADSKNHTVTAPTTNTRASHRQLHHTTGHYSLRLHALLENYQSIPLNALGMKASWDADEFWQEAFKAGTEPRFSPDQYGQQVG